MGLVVVTPPAAEPLSLAEFKLAARVTNAAEDSLITSLIVPAARDRYERDTRRQIVTATYDYLLFDFPPFRSGEGSEIEIPRPPLSSVTSVKYFDADGVQQTMPGTDYLVTAGREPGRVYPAPEKSWPVTQSTRLEERVTIRFVAGKAAGSIEPIDKIAIQLLALHLFENREAVVVDGSISVNTVPLGYEAIARQRRITEL